jgi:hypothetical protein
MGNEARCRVEIDGQSADAKALLETDELIVRGGLRAKIPFREAQDVVAHDGVLQLRFSGSEYRLHLGPEASKWAEKIRNPKSVLDKLGIKPGQVISLTGTLDPSFLGDHPWSRTLAPSSDIIFLGASSRDELTRLVELRKSLASNGAIWVIRPKGVSAITEGDVMAAGKAAGLVDVKVVRFSDSHTAEKLVIPVSARP